MLPVALCFVDTETTGLNPSFHRIIEIGIIKVINNKIVDEYETLVNPGTGVSEYIKNITGITYSDLEHAPTFYEIKDKILNLLSNGIFVAHNSHFDYGFLKNEFKRLDISFSVKHLCSVKLAKQLFPKLTHYNLDSIISYFNIPCARRHRAFYDAKAIFQFYSIAQKLTPDKKFNQAIDTVLKRPSLPTNIQLELLDSLPESTGVYIFLDKDNIPIYVGKSINIRDRILSHFNQQTSNIKDLHIAQEIYDIQTITTAGELGALLLESTLIKKYKPRYNRMLREVKRMTLALKTFTDQFSTVEVKEVNTISIESTEKIIGVFKSKKQLIDHLYGLAKQFCLCPKLLGLEKAKTNCFYYHLNICKGACIGKEKSLAYNLRFDQAFYAYKIKRWIFDSPIIIKEKGEKEEGFIIDKWCLLGSVKQDNDLNNISYEYNFDLDTYKILSKFLLNPQKYVSIIQLSPTIINKAKFDAI